MRAQRRQREDAQLAAARLEIELLKKHLQPHFLMNTLTAAMEWMEEQPDVGVRFIEALADELRLLVDVSDQTHIPLAMEINLCRRHLDVMGYRQDRTFQLQVEGVDPEAPVPPAIFHTLLENALTHNRYTDPTVCFQLDGELLAGGWRYTLHAPLNGHAPAIDREGTGLRYVKARLRESFGEAWSLASTPRNDTWTTVIELRDSG
jgi:LytS/YehU family sensor histidine kinase